MRTLETGILGTVMLHGGKDRTKSQRQANEEEAAAALNPTINIEVGEDENGRDVLIEPRIENEKKPLEVRYFAGEIAYTAFEITDAESEASLIKNMAVGALANNVGIAYLLKNSSYLLNMGAGAVTAATARTVDIISTAVYAKHTSDTRFTEYGINNYTFETSEQLSVHPSSNEVLSKGLRGLPVVGLIGFFVPFVGRGYAGASPFIAMHNLRAAHAIGKSFEIGDKVKSLISEGKDQNYIRDFLYDLSPSTKSNSIDPGKRELPSINEP